MSALNPSTPTSSLEDVKEIRWVLPDGSSVQHDTIVGIGHNSLVIRHGPGKVLKIPRQDLSTLDGVDWLPDLLDLEANVELLQNELRAYTRLQQVEGIAAFHGFVAGGILLDYYPDGSLESVISNEVKPDTRVQLRSMSEAIRIVHRCHQAGVLLFDIALRNFVVAQDQSLKAIDFAQAEVLPLGMKSHEANADGLTAKVDLFHLGCLLYSLATWTKFQMDCDDEEHWPDPCSLPSTVGLPFGFLIWSCWRKRYHSADKLLHESCSPRARRKQKARCAKERRN